jgi:hypothetical protein
MQTAKTKEILATDKTDGIKVVSRVTHKTVKNKNLGNGNGSLGPGRRARPQRTEGKHHNLNGQRKLE